jgi:adenosylhomocysteine nucleosidase
VLYAFDAEGALLEEQMTISSTDTLLGRPVVLGLLSGEDIVLAESGIGMTNAAMTAQKMIDRYDPQGVVFSGIAGAIDSSVQIGDIVVCRQWRPHDYGYIGAEGLEPRGCGVYQPEKDSVVLTTTFYADSGMLAIAAHLVERDLGLDSIGSRRPSLIVEGVGVTGNTFIDSHDKRQWLSREFSALVTDMESAAVAQVCCVNELPYIIFRSASDLAGGSGSQTAEAELDQFFEVAADNSSKVVTAFLGEVVLVLR